MITFKMTAQFAQTFSQEWIAAWNRHDLDAILSHYRDDFTMSSPIIQTLLGLPEGQLTGKANVAAYWQKALDSMPDLTFEWIDVLAGVDSVIIYYYGAKRRRAAEIFYFDETGLVYKAAAHYTSEH